MVKKTATADLRSVNTQIEVLIREALKRRPAEGGLVPVDKVEAGAYERF